MAWFYSKELEKKVAQRVNRETFDRILVFSSPMAEYVRNEFTIPKVMDFVDVESAKWLLYSSYHSFPLSFVYRLEADRLARYEETVARSFDRSVFVSKTEADLFRRRVRDRPISVIPNGVDLDCFAPNGTRPSWCNKPAIVFTGAMDYFPNVDAVRYFCQEVFPLIRKVIPSARFYIVGRHPTRQVRVLGHQENVVVTGSVPDVRP